MAKVKHKIKGILYWYEHTRVGKKVVCKYLGRVGGGGRSHRATDTTRLANSPYATSYTSQDDLDAEVSKAYQQGYGTKRIQQMFEDIDLRPTRRAVENYLTQDLGIELRKRAPKPTNTVPDYKSELEQAETTIALRDIETDSKDIRIRQMETAAMQDAARIAALEAKLRDYRDMGRAPTAEEIEGMYK